MEEIKGYVEHIVYRNEDNGYTVFNLNNEDGDLTCVGTFLYIEEGELLKLTGEICESQACTDCSFPCLNQRSANRKI